MLAVVVFEIGLELALVLASSRTASIDFFENLELLILFLRSLLNTPLLALFVALIDVNRFDKKIVVWTFWDFIF